MKLGAIASSIAIGMCAIACPIATVSSFGAPCTTDHDCGDGYVCGNASACVPGAHLDAGVAGEGEGAAAGEGEGVAGEGEGAAEGEGEGERCGGCATITLNDFCTPAAALDACATDASCACDAHCDHSIAECVDNETGSSGLDPWLRATLTWSTPAGSAGGPDLDLIATARDHDGQFCVDNQPVGCESFDTSGALVTACAAGAPLECADGTCDLTTAGDGLVTRIAPDWTDDTAGLNAQDPIRIGSTDPSAPEIIALGSAPAANRYIYGVTLCGRTDDAGAHATFEVTFVDRQGDVLATCSDSVDAFTVSYQDAAIVHVDANGNACVDCATGPFKCP